MPITLSKDILHAKKNAKIDKKTFRDMQQKAEAGDSSQLCNYSFCHLYGINVVCGNNQQTQLKQNLELAETNALLALVKGDVDALVFLVIAYLEGNDNVPKNHQKTIKLLNLALTKTSILNETLKNIRNKLKDSTFENQQIIACQLFQLGHDILKECQGKGKQMTIAIMLFKSADHLGNVAAKFSLGNCYDCGLGVSVDLARASSLYCTAAMMGSFDAQYRLSRLFKDGLGGLPKDPHMAERLLEAASFGTTQIPLISQKENSQSQQVIDRKTLHEYDPSMPNGFWGKFKSTEHEAEVCEAMLIRNPIHLNWIGLNQVQKALDERTVIYKEKPLNKKKVQENLLNLQENLKLIQYSACLGNLAAVYSYAQYLKRGIGVSADLKFAHRLFVSRQFAGIKKLNKRQMNLKICCNSRAIKFFIVNIL